MNPTVDLSHRLDEVAAAHVRADGPGLAYAVVLGGEVVARNTHGLAVLEHGVPIGTDTRFYLCSLAKQMTAAVVVRLVAAGAFSLDDPVTRWLPELRLPDASIRLHHLLHHTSGLRDYLALQFMSGEAFEDGFDRDDVLTLAELQHQVEFTPGTRHAYGNTGYTLLAAVSEAATGESWPALLQSHVFEPLGMTGAAAPRLGDVVTGMATGYTRAGRSYRRRGLRHVVPGPGGIVATIDDLVAWEQLLAGVPAHADLHRALVTGGVLSDGSPVGYGGGLALGTYRGHVTHGHGGGFPGWSTWITHLPEIGVTAIVLANDEGIGAGTVAHQLLDVFLDERGAPPVGANTAADETAGQPVTMVATPGRYLDTSLGDSWDIRLDDRGSLQVGRHGTWVDLPPAADDGTYPTPGPERLRFHEGGADVLRNGAVFGRYQRVEPFEPAHADYEGTYECPELGLLCEVRSTAEGLMLRRGHRPPILLSPTRTDEFVTAVGSVRLEREHGRVTGGVIDNMQVHGIVLRRLA